jgi:hypothetical protein
MTIVLAVFAGILLFGAILCFGIQRSREPRSENADPAGRFGPDGPGRDERFMKRFKPSAEQSHARVCWVHGGQKHTVKSQVVDLSDDGARVKIDVPLEPEMSVVLEMPRMRLAGTAIVRYCRQRKKAYNVGLSFRGPLFRTP